MTAGEFLSRAEPLLQKSKVALVFSSEARTLLKTVGEAAQQNRARLEAERASGKLVSTCLPPKGKASVNATELVNYLRAIPPAQRGQSFDQAFAGYVARKYPCRG
jgi:hypothetical protein